MKSNFPKGVFIIIQIFFLLSVSQLAAQMPGRNPGQAAVTGWLDDSHYLFRTWDSEGKAIIQSVDIRTGKGTVISLPETSRDLLEKSLPEGTQPKPDDIVSPDNSGLIRIIDNDLFYFRTGDKEFRRLTDDNAPEVNVRFCDDGSKIAYTRNRDLYVYDLVSFKETRLTHDASDRIYNGYASWVYMEEILGRASRFAAFWWSPDGSRIAYLRTDESDVPMFTLNRLDEEDGIHGTLEQVPYPKAGDPNPRVRMGIADLATGETVWVKTDYSADQYIAWPFWTPDSRHLAVQILNRDQNNLSIILADPLTGDYREIYNEWRRTWVEFMEDIYVMKNGSGFIIRSFMNDWENLYFYAWEGRLIAQLTDFDFRVTSVIRVDEDQKTVYFTATGPESTDLHAWRVGLDGKNLVRLTTGEGSHNISISPKGTYYIDTWNSLSDPGSIIAYNRKGRMIREIHRYEIPSFDPGRHARSEMIRIPTSDGLFNMPAIITYPLNFDPAEKYPVLFRIYGGPDSRNVYNRWQGTDLSWYSQNGIIVFTVDHRGSGQFGRNGLDYLHRSLGRWEILDYADAVEWLRTKSFVDPARIGITGSSYGGYMTCMALTRGADYWTHGFAGSSVTDWRLYDNIYTERFMDTPGDNPEGYRQGSALTWAENYRGKLYMTHGDMD
ncbi:MAG TPA: DPP IV N-terminal domain-containing protein, partial [Bacteroidales bacterium]|nr:DPP IV N-terminal domain-containing protein [Bacteroidales bacterium]